MPRSNGPKFSITDTPRFNDPDAAREFLEAKRWPDGPICPHCGVEGEAYRLEAGPEVKAKRQARKGLWKCAACRKQFTVTIGTIFEDSKIPLHKWLHAIHMLCSSKKGISAHQLHRNLGVTYKSAWFMAHRIRWSMTQEPLSSKLDGIVEVDDTYIGGKRRTRNWPSNMSEEKKKRILGENPKPWDSKVGVAPGAGKAIVTALVQRGGKVRSMHVERVTAETLRPILDEYLADGAHLMTDSAAGLKKSGKDQWKHDTVNHTAKEYVRYENGVCISTNTVEGYFALLKRGINGVYHHVGKNHLHRYLSEFDFRYNARDVDDVQRADMALDGTEGKRLFYRDSSVPKA